MKKLLYLLFLVFSIFALAGCDSVFGDDDSDDDYETIDISSRNLTTGVDDGYYSLDMLRYFNYENSDSTEVLELYFYYSPDPSAIAKPVPGTYSLVDYDNIDASGEVFIEYSDDSFYYDGISGSVTVSDDSMTITLSDVSCKKYTYDDEDTGEIVKFIGSTTVTSYQS